MPKVHIGDRVFSLGNVKIATEDDNTNGTGFTIEEGIDNEVELVKFQSDKSPGIGGFGEASGGGRLPSGGIAINLRDEENQIATEKNTSSHLINRWTETCLASLGDSKAIDNPVVVAACSNAANTLWKINNNGEIRNRWTNTCLASLGDSKVIDNPVVVAACSGAANTLWEVKNNGEIRNRWTETCLASLGDSKAIDNPVVVAACSGNANILWTVKNH